MLNYWMSPKTAGKHAGVKPDTIYKWITLKKLKAHRIRGAYRIELIELECWMKERKETLERLNA